MPLTRTGRTVLIEFKKEYGKRGKSIFYAYMKKYPKKTIKWHQLKKLG